MVSFEVMVRVKVSKLLGSNYNPSPNFTTSSSSNTGKLLLEGHSQACAATLLKLTMTLRIY